MYGVNCQRIESHFRAYHRLGGTPDLEVCSHIVGLYKFRGRLGYDCQATEDSTRLCESVAQQCANICILYTHYSIYTAVTFPNI